MKRNMTNHAVEAAYALARQQYADAGVDLVWAELSNSERGPAIEFARAMMLEPKIILLDEPTEGLMPRMVSQISEIIDALHQEGVAILLVEQNVPLTLASSQRVYFMEKGAVRHHAMASELKVNDPVIHQYLGV